MANLLTIGRIGLIIPLILVFFSGAVWDMKAAFVIFVIAALSDFFDGYIARARGETSALGAALDPIADKLLIAASLILLVKNGAIGGAGVIAAVAIVLREILVSGLREAVSSKGGSLPVSQLGKLKTFAQLAAVATLMAALPGGVIGATAMPIGTGLLWLAAVLTFWSGADYAVRAAAHLRNSAS